MKLKIFEVPFWAKKDTSRLITEKDFLKCVEEKIKPVFNRHGLYLDRETKTCWIECEYGSYQYNRGYNQTMYTLKYLDPKLLTDKESQAIEYLIKCRIADKNLIRLYAIDKEYKDSIKRSRSYRKIMLTVA